MKRLITAVSFAVLAMPAFAGAPYDQLEVDRALPQIEKKSSERTSTVKRGLPFEQAELDRAMPVL